MADLLQPSFARGEIGPELYAREDVAAYRVALKTAINMVVHAQGGISNRPGLPFVCPCANHSGTPPRLIEFKYNTNDTYILEFGDQIMRVVRNDAQVLEAAKNITGATAANPVVITSNSHGFSNGDDVYITGVVGMTQLNGRWFTVANKATNTFELTSQQTSASIDGTGYTAYSSGGTASRVYQITTPYAIADTYLLKKAQSNNVMRLTHPSYPPQELTRTGHSSWTITETSFVPSQAGPTGVAVTPVTTGTTTYQYKVTAVNDETGESLAGKVGAGSSCTATTAANPVVVTSAGHSFATGDEVALDGFTEATELNGRHFIVGATATNTFELKDEDGTGYAAETTGGTAWPTYVKITNGDATPKNDVSWTAAADADRYSIYRLAGGVYGYLGDSTTLTYREDNQTPDTSLSPPGAADPFHGTNNYPAVVGFFEQRCVYGRTNAKPITNFYSKIGDWSNMSAASPRADDDAMVAALPSKTGDEIRAFSTGNDFMVFTAGDEWRVNSGNDTAFTASTIKQKAQTHWGSSWRDPITVDNKTLFVTANDTYIRSIGYEVVVDSYRGDDITVFAPHIFKTYSIVDWALSLSPDPVISIVRSDGWAASLTFNPEQQIVAWARWKTLGKFLRVATTRPSTDEKDTFPYFVVQRTIGGASAYYIERLASRRFTDVRDCFFVDCGLSYDVPLTITNVTAAWPVVVTSASHGLANGDEVDLSDIVWEPDFDDNFNEVQPAQLNDNRYFVVSAATNTFELAKISGRKDITAATKANPIVVTSAGHGYSNGDVVAVFDVVGMVELNNKTFKIAGATTDTFQLTTLAGTPIDSTGYTTYVSGGEAYPTEDGSAFNAYVSGGYAREAVSTFGNLWHLEGREVVCLADGNVITGKTVSSGSVTLARKFSRVHIGLRYISDFETLTPSIPRGTLQGAHVAVQRVKLLFNDTRGALVGPNSQNLTEMKQREFENMGQPTQLLAGSKRMNIPVSWTGKGRVFVRQVNPLPMTILGIVPDISKGDTDSEE